jgi:hypothetical protein
MMLAMLRFVFLAAFAVLALSARTASAWCDEPWVPVTTARELPAGCPLDLWMDNAGQIYRWDGEVRGEALDGEILVEDVRSMGVNFGCIVGQCSWHRRDYVFYPDRVRFTLADPPGTTVTLGDSAGPLVELTITDGGGCPAGEVAPGKQCGDPSACYLGCEDEDESGCSAGGARPRDTFPVAIIAALAAAVAFVTRRRRQRRARV